MKFSTQKFLLTIRASIGKPFSSFEARSFMETTRLVPQVTVLSLYILVVSLQLVLHNMQCQFYVAWKLKLFVIFVGLVVRIFGVTIASSEVTSLLFDSFIEMFVDVSAVKLSSPMAEIQVNDLLSFNCDSATSWLEIKLHGMVRIHQICYLQTPQLMLKSYYARSKTHGFQSRNKEISGLSLGRNGPSLH